MLQFDRHRRLRTSAAMRDLVRESHLNKDDFTEKELKDIFTYIEFIKSKRQKKTDK